MPTTGTELPPKTNEARFISPVSEEPLLTPADLKELYLFGIPLTDKQKNVLSDRVFEFAIKASQEYFERKLDIIIKQTLLKQERQDYVINNYVNWGFLTTNKRPVWRIESIRLIYGNQKIFNVPNEWIQLDELVGEIHLIPTIGAFSTHLIGQGGLLLPLLTHRHDYVPGVFEMDYTVGWPDDKIPQDLLEVIGKRATNYILNIMGDILLGAGIANQSLSLSGLSQSIGTTQSAENSAYSARVRMYDKDIKDYLKDAKQIFGRMPVVVA